MVFPVRDWERDKLVTNTFIFVVLDVNFFHFLYEDSFRFVVIKIIVQLKLFFT
jgi:hypothetical protein